MATIHNPPLSSAEISQIWTSYQEDTIAICMLKYFLETIEDPDIAALLQHALGLSQSHIPQLKDVRVDARGNKKGIDVQFSTNEELLAFSTDEDNDEKDYTIIYTKPHPKTLATLKEHTDAVEMYKHHLPEYL